METISPDDGLLRRVFINQIKPDGTIVWPAFRKRKVDTDGFSVDLERLTTHQRAIADRMKFRLARLEARVPISLNLDCIHAPKHDNPAHSLIKGEFNEQVSRSLASSAEIVKV